MRDAAPEEQAGDLRAQHSACKAMLASVKKAVLIADRSASSKIDDERARKQARINSIASLHQLHKSQRVVAETEQVAATVLDDLSVQRAQLEKTRSTLAGMNNSLERSDRRLNQMGSWWAWCAGVCAG